MTLAQQENDDTVANKDSRKVRVRTCTETITIPAEEGEADVKFRCSLKKDMPTNHHIHRSNGYVFRKNGTAARYKIEWENVGHAEARIHQ